MREMNLYGDARQVQISEEYYRKLLKYKDNYYLVLQEIMQFFEFKNDNTVYSVDADALADFLIPYMEEFRKVCN